MTHSPVILVLGATGKAGSRVARMLEENRIVSLPAETLNFQMVGDAAYGEVLRNLSTALTDNNRSRPTQNVHTRTGREPRPFADFAKRKAGAWSVQEVKKDD